MNDHPTKICDIYTQTKARCEECMDAETEIDFWHECYNGKHNKPEDCPTWYDWCNCGVTMFEDIEYLLGQVDRLKRELKETKCLLEHLFAAHHCNCKLDEESK